jgi:hypothetical protein
MYAWFFATPSEEAQNTSVRNDLGLLTHPSSSGAIVHPMSTTKKFLAAGGLVAAILVGSLTLAATGIVGPANAQTPSAESMLTSGDHGGWFARFRHHRREVRRHVADLTADTIGVSREQLRDELKAGSSIADVANGHGVDPQVVVDTLAADANGRVDQALANGRIDEEQATKIKDRLPQAVQKLVDHVFGG